MDVRGRFADRPLFVACGCWLLCTWLVVLVPPIRSTVLRPVFVYPAALFVPGYVVLVALPFDTDTPADSGSPRDAVELLFLSLAASVAVCMLLGIGLLLTPLGVSAWSVLAGLSALALCCLVAVLARAPPPAVDGAGTAGTPLSERIAALRARDLRDGLPGGEWTASWPDARATVAALVLVGGLLGTGAVVYLPAIHQPAGYTELAVTPANGSWDDTTGPRAVGAGDPLSLRVTNHYDRTVEYTVTAQVQTARTAGDAVTVSGTRDLRSFAFALAPDETWTTTHDPSVPTSDGTRLAYRLTDRPATGGQSPQVHVWVAGPDPGNASTPPREVAP